MVSAVLIKGLPKLAKKGWKKLTADKDAIRLKEINEKLKKTPEKAHIPGFTEKASVRQDVAEDHAQEVFDIYARSQAKDKK
tara:strand:+ start:67 stop:309 length:243 start_codon:yes stop_codon:yes gene_type:complete